MATDDVAPLMGYALITGPCFVCGRTFGYNPHLVPSVPIGADGKPAVGGQRQAICRTCAELANNHRRIAGLELFEVSDEAYGPFDEADL